jgi:hypothetical protein
VIVKLDIVHQNTLQVTLVEYKQLVNTSTFIAHRADPALRKGIGLGCLWQGEDDFHLSATNTVSKAVLSLPS